jgi:tRNA-guanine family transglycosylase
VGMTEFQVIDTAGDARTGRLSVNGRELATPYMFPVVNFYGGGTDQSLYGGGTHRTLKEFLTGHPPVVGQTSYDDLFEGVMLSIASLTDYEISQERLDDYLAAPIRERDVFSRFDGLLFVDSGGYKFLTQGELTGRDFSIELDQETAFDLQQRLGGDILVNLDYPITPEDSYEEKTRKLEQTIENAKEFVGLASDHEGALFLTVHGYNRSMFERFFDLVEGAFSAPIDAIFDGLAIGSLVPKKDNVGDLIEATRGCVNEARDRGYGHLPVHVFGISGRAIPLLVAVGADTFDSSSYIHSAINGKYKTDFLTTAPLDEAPFEDCACRVCSDPKHVERMRGNAEFQKDTSGSVAIHNLELINRELERTRRAIADGEDAYSDYLEALYRDHQGMRKYAFQVINETLDQFF